MNRLSKEAQSIVDDACQAEKPPSGAKARIQTGVLAAIGGGAALASTTAASSAAASAAGISSMGAVLVKAIAVVTLVGAVGTTVAVQPWDDEEPVEAPVVTSPLPSPEAPAVIPTAIPAEREAEPETLEAVEVESGTEEELEIAAVEEADPSPSPRPASAVVPTTTPVTAEPPPSVTADVAEMQEIVRTNQAGNHQRALDQLLNHRSRFPQSALGMERAALRVTLLCRLNRLGEANDLGQRFLQRHPDSYLAERIRQQCPSLR